MSKGKCPSCDRPFGKRMRCYFCSQAHRRLGTDNECERCLTKFYVPKWQADDERFNGGRFCSIECKADHQRFISPTPDTKHMTTDGYIKVFKPEHPRATRGRVFEHIVVAEQNLGRFLEPGEHVHHIDFDKKNNSPTNLMVLTASEHAKLHWELRKERFSHMAITTPTNIVAGTYGPFLNAGVPVNGTTLNNIAAKGALLIDTANGKLYINTGTLAANTWVVAGTQT